MKKQDRQGVRTPAALERKYDFTEPIIRLDALEATIGSLEAKIINTDLLLADVVKVGDLASGLTTIDGACIKTGIIFSENFDCVSDGTVTAGMCISLNHGTIETRNFTVNIDGKIFSTAGHIGGFDISPNGLSKTVTLENPTPDALLDYTGTFIEPAAIITEARYEWGSGGATLTRTKLTAGGIVREFEDTRGQEDFTLMTVMVNGEEYGVVLDPYDRSLRVEKYV
jgi:hypothetical protein